MRYCVGTKGSEMGLRGGGLTEKPRPCSYENYRRSFASVSIAAGGGKYYYSAPDRKRKKMFCSPSLVRSFVADGRERGTAKKRRKGPETQILAPAAVFPEEKKGLIVIARWKLFEKGKRRRRDPFGFMAGCRLLDGRCFIQG